MAITRRNAQSAYSLRKNNPQKCLLCGAPLLVRKAEEEQGLEKQVWIISDNSSWSDEGGGKCYGGGGIKEILSSFQRDLFSFYQVKAKQPQLLGYTLLTMTTTVQAALEDTRTDAVIIVAAV